MLGGERHKSLDKKIVKDWTRIILQHAVAWALLALLSMWIWSMTQTVINNTPMKNAETQQNALEASTSTAISSQIPQATTTTKMIIKPVVTTIVSVPQPAVQSTVPTTVPPTMTPAMTNTLPSTVVNGAMVENPAAFGSSKKVRIKVNGLNVRANPSSGGNVVGGLRRGEVVRVLGYNGAWLYVKNDKNIIGFIKADGKFEEHVE